MTDFLNKIKAFDIEAKILSSLNPKTTKIFMALIALNILTYIIFFTEHPLHNHGFRMPWIEPKHGYPHGRWFNMLLSYLTNKADIPAILPLIAILMCITSGFMALRIWKFDLSSIETFIVIGLLTTYPAYLAFYYFSWTTVLFMNGTFFALLATVSCRALRLSHIIPGGALVTIMMASYQPSISVFVTVSALACISAIMTSQKALSFHVFKPLIARALAAITGLIGYVVSIKLTGVQAHSTKGVELSEVPMRIKKVIEVSIEQFTITQPEFMSFMKVLLGILIIAAILSSLWLVRKSIGKTLVLLILWAGAILATKTMYLLSPDVQYYEYRYNTAAAFLYGFAAAILLQGLGIKIIKSIALIFTSFILLRFVQADLTRQEVLLRGQQHDIAFANRILTRIENLPDLDITKPYDLIRVGSYPHYRDQLLRTHNHSWEMKGDNHLDDARLTAAWADEDIFIHLGSSVKFKHRGFDPAFYKKAKEAKAKLLEGRKKWPDQSSVFISDDKIIIYLE